MSSQTQCRTISILTFRCGGVLVMARLLARSLGRRRFRFRQRGGILEPGRSAARSSSSAPVCLRRAACLLLRHSLDADVLRRHSASQPAAGPTAAVSVSPAHPSLCASAAASGDELLRASVLSPHPLSQCHTTLLLRDLVAPFRCPASASALFSLCFLFFLFLVRLDPSGPLPLFLAGVRFLAHAHACTLRLGSSMDFTQL